MNKELIAKIFTAASLVVLVIFLLWYMFGNSPNLEQIFILFVLPFAGGFFAVYEKLNNKIMNTGVHLQKELGEIKQTLGKIEGKLTK